jgi:hypothetical protein
MPDFPIFPKDRTRTVLVEMFSDRSGKWQVTKERIDILSSKEGLSGEHLATIEEMISIAKNGADCWISSPEAFSAIYRMILFTSHKNTKKTVAEILGEVYSGSQCDGVSDKPWVQAVISFLQSLDGGENEEQEI